MTHSLDALAEDISQAYEGPARALFDRQVAWETRCIDDGVRRYHRTLERQVHHKDGQVSRESANIADTQVGQWIMRDMVGLILPAMQEAREATMDLISRTLNGGRGAPTPNWGYMMCLLSAEKLTVIGIRTILTQPIRSEKGIGRPAMGVSLQIGTAIRDEVEMEMWLESSALAKKEGHKRIDVAAAMVAKTKVVDRRRFARWRAKLDEIERLEWTKEQRIQLGARVMEICLAHGGRWFEMTDLIIRGRTERRVVLSLEAKAAIADHHSRLETNRPYLLPMMCPPRPWRRNADATDD